MKKVKFLFPFVFSLAVIGIGTNIQGCSKYTITTTEHNPADVYFKKKVIASYFWSKWNYPQRLADSCGDAGLDEIKITTNLGYSLLHVVTLGCVSLVKVEWKCHKPCSPIGFQP
jgi:hypothetical protein